MTTDTSQDFERRLAAKLRDILALKDPALIRQALNKDMNDMLEQAAVAMEKSAWPADVRLAAVAALRARIRSRLVEEGAAA